jgi:hypothetical protein
MKKQITFLLILFIGVFSLHAEIVEVKHFSEVASHAKSGTLVITDIDDTLLVPHQMIGSDEWFSHRMNKHRADGLHPNSALEKTVAEAQAVRQLTQMKLAEPGTDKIIRSLQKKGFCVMGLTVQGSAVAMRTNQQLKSNNIDLTEHALSKEDQYFPLNGQNMLYKNNILFTTGTSKGEALFTLLDKIKVNPKRIIFIDDKASNVESVEKWAKKRNVQFIGLRYSYSDQSKAAFRPDIAEVQFNQSTFTHLLSDEEALSLMGSKEEEEVS